jgi:phosphoglycerate dehydrogenase-like enzyme
MEESVFTVLVPYSSKENFLHCRFPDIQPAYYQPKDELLFQRVMRKLGLRDIRQTFEARLCIVEGSDLLHKTRALWLSPDLCFPPSLMAYLLDLLPGLKWVYSQMTGTDHLDLEMFKGRGVIISNSGVLNSRRAAEMALACVFAHAKRLPKHIAMQRMCSGQSLPTDDLHRQTVGILGTGNIGREMATLCRAIGMHVVGASRDPKRFGNDPFPYHRIVRLEEDLGLLLAEADHVILALPLTSKTRGLIGRNELRLMKPNASLINLARGAIVNDLELSKALSDGVIAGAYIDPPTRLSSPLFRRLYRAGILVLIHNSAAHSPHRQKEAFEQFIEGFREIMETGVPPNRVV